jgi:hypothetical protein
LPTSSDCGTVDSRGIAAFGMKDDPELFATEPAPKRRTRTKRAATTAEPEPVPEVAMISEAVATLDDLRVAGERFIREQPLLAVSLAVGLGYLIGRLRR